MKKLELNQMENVMGSNNPNAKYKMDHEAPVERANGGGGYCTKEATGMLLAVGGLAFAAATGGIGAIAVAGLSFYLGVDSVASGSCSSW